VPATETFKHIRRKHRPESEYFTVIIQVKEELKKTSLLFSGLDVGYTFHLPIDVNKSTFPY